MCLFLIGDFIGFYARITSMDEIHDKVFEYVKVLARPMVLYLHDHPIHWSPVYVGGKVRRFNRLENHHGMFCDINYCWYFQSSRYGRENRGQLMTSVSAPILDRRNYTVYKYKIYICIYKIYIYTHTQSHTHTHTHTRVCLRVCYFIFREKKCDRHFNHALTFMLNVK